MQIDQAGAQGGVEIECLKDMEKVKYNCGGKYKLL